MEIRINLNKKMKVSDFEILDRVAKEGSADGIAAFPDLLRGNLIQEGGEITFGVSFDALQWALAGSHTFILYAVKKEDYLRVKGELENGLPIVV